MKKGKFSWQTFLMTLLVIILLGCLVYYLEQNKVLEGFEDGKGNVATLAASHEPSGNTLLESTNAEPTEKTKSLKEPDSVTIDNKKDKAKAAVTQPKKSSNNSLKTDTVATAAGPNKAEGFRNMLSYSPVASQGPQPGCVDSLKPYEKYNCGPIDVNNFFGGLKFKPECCGNPAGSSYSNSVGCACICPEQWTFLNSRGGNRTFPTEF
jgi:hypothetical protein